MSKGKADVALKEKPPAAKKRETRAAEPALVVAYKAFDADWSCRGFKYEIGKTYTIDGKVTLCQRGFHACLVPFDATFNPWIGCTRVSAGCEHCYAETLSKRTGLAQWGPKATRHFTRDANWNQPLKWNEAAQKSGWRARVFCASMADVFDDHPSIRPEWRSRLWTLIANTPHLDWLLLTKRPHRWFAPFSLPSGEIAPAYQRHVRLGVTIENEAAFDARAGALVIAHSFGWKTFVSYEPALGPVDWRPLLEAGAIGWLIAGGESGAGARPAHPDWFRATRDQCGEFAVPFFFKQFGEFTPHYPFDPVSGPRVPVHTFESTSLNCGGYYCDERIGHVDCGTHVYRVGKRTAGRELDGVVHDAFPVAA